MLAKTLLLRSILLYTNQTNKDSGKQYLFSSFCRISTFPSLPMQFQFAKTTLLECYQRTSHTSHGENPNQEADAPVPEENHRRPVSAAGPLSAPGFPGTP